MQTPLITDWIQAIGTIVAILLSSLIAVFVPISIRSRDVKRYRIALGQAMSETLLNLSILKNEEWNHADYDDLGRAAQYKTLVRRFKASLDGIRSVPLVMLELPSVNYDVSEFIVSCETAFDTFEDYHRPAMSYGQVRNAISDADFDMNLAAREFVKASRKLVKDRIDEKRFISEMGFKELDLKKVAAGEGDD